MRNIRLDAVPHTRQARPTKNLPQDLFSSWPPLYDTQVLPFLHPHVLILPLWSQLMQDFQDLLPVVNLVEPKEPLILDR